MLAIKTTQKFLLIFISFVALVVVLCLFFVVLFFLCILVYLFQLLFPFCCLLCSSFSGEGGENVFRCVFNHKTNYAALQATSSATTTATNNANNCKIFIIKTC